MTLFVGEDEAVVRALFDSGAARLTVTAKAKRYRGAHERSAMNFLYKKTDGLGKYSREYLPSPTADVLPL